MPGCVNTSEQSQDLTLFVLLAHRLCHEREDSEMWRRFTELKLQGSWRVYFTGGFGFLFELRQKVCVIRNSFTFSFLYQKTHSATGELKRSGL